MKPFHWLTIFCLLALILAAMSGCESGDDDDNDDNDSADDDLDDDDDDDDDDVGDDDRLLLIGYDGVRLASWLQTDDGWRKMEIPQPELTTDETDYRLGPSLVVDGQTVHSAWNITNEQTYSSTTKRHQWLLFDEADGWRFADREPTAAGHNVRNIGLTADGVFWADTYYHYSWWYPNGDGYEHDERLYSYTGNSPVAAYDLQAGSVEAWAMPASGGWAGVLTEHEFAPFTFSFLTFADGQWTETAMPLDWQNGFFTALTTDDAQTGYGVFCEVDAKGFFLTRLAAEGWTQIPTPDSCLEGDLAYVPRRLTGAADHVLGYSTYGTDNRFLELRDGQWNCRKTIGYETEIRGGVVLTDGRAFLWLDLDLSSADPVLVEVLDDSLDTVSLPDDLLWIEQLLAIGSDVPPRFMVDGAR
ncbi:MAG TPA: hypothetical protein PKW95_22060 [bacterium]|nr:hypothetical protein [bacterium]